MMSVEDTFFKLHQLQDTEEVRKLFADHGVKAERYNAYSCAVTVFVKQESTVQMCVTGSHRSIVDGEKFFPHTPALVKFVEKFDAGDYPELIA
jgi:hypothetical protein